MFFKSVVVLLGYDLFKTVISKQKPMATWGRRGAMEKSELSQDRSFETPAERSGLSPQVNKTISGWNEERSDGFMG